MFPGAPAAGTDIYSEAEMKMVLYRLMRPAWKTSFDAAGYDITDVDYKWDHLERYMAAQERVEIAQRGGRTGRFGGSGRFSGRGRYGGRSSNRYSGQVRPYNGYQGQQGYQGSQGGYYPPAQRARYQYAQPGYTQPYGQANGRGYSGYDRGTGRGYNGRNFVPRGGGRGRAPTGRGRAGRIIPAAYHVKEQQEPEEQQPGPDEVHAVESFESPDRARSRARRPPAYQQQQYYEEEEHHWNQENFVIMDPDEVQEEYGDY